MCVYEFRYTHGMKKLLIAGVLLAGVIIAVVAQQRKAPSPAAETSVTIDGKKIAIHYSAPSMRGRKIFGGLEAYGRVWRTGANEATKLTTEATLQIGNLTVPKGEYSIFTWIDPKQWQLIVNKETGQSGLDYKQNMDLGRVPMDMSKPASPVETFAITLTSTGGKQGLLKLAWENTVASAPFTVK
jgi:hypothetical protein